MSQQVKNKSEKIGEISTIYKRGKTWWLNAQYGGKQVRKSLKTRNKKQARAKAILLERELLQEPTAPKVPLIPVTIETAADDLIRSCEAEELRPKTITKYRQVLDTVTSFAEDNDIDDLTQLDPKFVDRYKQYRKGQEAKPKTIHNEVGIIRRLLHFAKTRRMIAEDPLEGLRLPKPKTGIQPCWSKSDIEKILENAFPGHQAIFTLLAETGMRIGELMWLTWEDIDMEQNLIHIRPKDNWTTKTGNVRAIPMSARTREIILAQEKNHRWVFTARASIKYPKGDHQVSERRLLESLKRTLKKTGLDGHLHTFRHSFISRAIVEGIPEAVIRDWVGHVDRKTLQHYTHIADQASQAAMKKLNP